MSAVSYFDASYLKAYVESGLDLSIYVNGRYLSVPSVDDIIPGKKGEAFDENGKPVKFDYADIDHIRVGSITFSKDMLNSEDEESAEESDEGENNSEEDSSSAKEQDTGN